MKVKHVQEADARKKAAIRLYKAIASIKTAEEAKLFFEDLCTPAELQAITDRWLVVPSILEKKPYREIYEDTGVSVTTIGRVARSLMLGTGGYSLIFERLKNEKKKKN